MDDIDKKISKWLDDGLPIMNKRQFKDFSEVNDLISELDEYEKSSEFASLPSTEKPKNFLMHVICLVGDVTLQTSTKVRNELENSKTDLEAWKIAKKYSVTEPLVQRDRVKSGRGWSSDEIKSSGIATKCFNKLGLRLDSRRKKVREQNITMLQIFSRFWKLIGKS